MREISDGSEPIHKMSKRECIAAMAMQGYLAHGLTMVSIGGDAFNIVDQDKLAKVSCLAADALIAELNKKTK